MIMVQQPYHCLSHAYPLTTVYKFYAYIWTGKAFGQQWNVAAPEYKLRFTTTNFHKIFVVNESKATKQHNHSNLKLIRAEICVDV